ncbi:peptidoglycan editing factor PgeF [Segniliparus rugosus]|uniref:Purine nucleoside phosphorylase n=1 Tax=Segniliparus rugosus (strain ATCC BAA-974 / DSM 45345 / CCUG 50838 / CIP 108380 / JCM 13579 / CDC 945) TaxID=679197 RepID=E5XTN4_SEGRC|nr:peptidoglycan editing factor PgeF [Segniliparus rugosus]EFV12296.1 hypothetical protein HMPREF9336_02856 [Segniliparus rugosus ATCC BAA-974]
MTRVRTLTTTVADGDMRDPANRERLADEIGIPAGRFVWLNQVHSAKVAVVDRLWPEADGPLVIAETDGAATNLPGVALAILTADCVPVVALDVKAGVVGAAHAGRVGAQNGIVRELVARMVGLGAKRERIAVRLGPSASGASYEVPSDMRDEVEALLPGSACATEAGTAGLDLRAGLVRQLGEIGVKGHVSNVKVCTIKDTRFFSHRRDKSAGRFATVVWQSEADRAEPVAPRPFSGVYDHVGTISGVGRERP